MKYDVIIIGTGQAGPPLAFSLAKNGYKVAIIEKSQLGGTCVNDGCTPTKAYIASARRAFVAKNSNDLGVSVKGKVEIDLQKIKERKDKLVQASREGMEKGFQEEKNITFISGKAFFTDDQTIQVNGEKLSAEKIFINVGGRARIPQGFEIKNCLTNSSILQLEEIPKKLIIVGGGYVGLEFGQMFSRFGSEVTILERGEQILEKEDADFAEIISEMFQENGIVIKLNSDCVSGEREGQNLQVNFDCDEGRQSIKGSHILLAAGRVPNTDDLGLENTGVTLDENGFIEVNEFLQTKVPHIWAMGDCNGQGAFTHTAYNDFQIVNSYLLKNQKKKLSDRINAYAAFIDPPIARAGINEKEIKQKGIKAQVAELSMSKIARAKEKGETNGKLKVFIDSGSKKILGATFMGVGADEFIHAVLDQMYAGENYEVLLNAVHIHPTVSELIPTMLHHLKDL